METPSDLYEMNRLGKIVARIESVERYLAFLEVCEVMGKRSKRKKRARQNQLKRLKKLLAGGRLYLNMESKEWQAGLFNDLDIRGHCVGYRIPRGTTPEEEQTTVQKWREIDAIYNKHPAPVVTQPKPKKPKIKKQSPPPPKKKKFRLQVAHVELELVGTEL